MGAKHNSGKVRRGQTIGPLRTALVLAEAIKEELGPDTSNYTEKQLEKLRVHSLGLSMKRGKEMKLANLCQTGLKTTKEC